MIALLRAVFILSVFAIMLYPGYYLGFRAGRILYADSYEIQANKTMRAEADLWYAIDMYNDCRASGRVPFKAVNAEVVNNEAAIQENNSFGAGEMPCLWKCY